MHNNKLLSDKEIDSRFSKMSPEKKLRLSIQLYNDSKELKRGWLKSRHIDWSEEEIDKKVIEIFMYARS